MSVGATNLVTAEGLRQSIGGNERRVELYSNLDATQSNKSITLNGGVSGFRFLEITTVKSVQGSSQGYMTTVIPVKWANGCYIPFPISTSDVYLDSLILSGNTLSFKSNYAGIVRVVGIV